MQKQKSKTPEAKIERAVERYLAGEPASELAKEHRMSRQGFYLWVKNYKEAQISKAKYANMTAGSIDKSQKVDLAIENTALKAEVERLKQKLFEIMLATDRL